MKRSLFIAIVVLLMAALFVSCNADKAVEDQLFEVTIDGGARTLQASGIIDVDIENLVWFYEATKTSGGFKSGQTDGKTAVKANAAPGLTGSSLGQFSKGTWQFKFYGYNAADVVSGAIAANAEPIFQQIAGCTATIAADYTLSVTLERGAGTLPAATVKFDTLNWYHADFKNEDHTLTLSIFVEGETTPRISGIAGTWTAADGKAVFTTTETITLTAASTLSFRVYEGEDIIGTETIPVAATAGMAYTISVLGDESGITPVDTTYGVTIDVAGTEATLPITTETAVSVKSPASPDKSQAAAATTVTFPAGSFTSTQATATENATLTINVMNVEEASAATFAVLDGSSNTAIGAISLDIEGIDTSSFGGKAVTIETFIAPGLNAAEIAVVYNGTTGAQPTIKSYDSSTGKLVFETTHFSEYVIVSTAAVAFNADTKAVYTSLQAAIDAAQAGETIKLIKDVSITSPVTIAKDLALDGNGHKIDGTANRGVWVDSSDVDFTIKNCTIGSATNTKMERGLQVNTDCTNVTLTVDNCTIYATYYAINFCSNTVVDFTITNSTVTGWGALNIWSNGVSVVASDSSFIGINNKAYNADGWNNFGTIVLEADTTHQTNLNSSDMQVSLLNCTITATATTGNLQVLVLFNGGLTGAYANSVSLTNCTLESEQTKKFIDNGTDNKLLIDGISPVANVDGFLFFSLADAIANADENDTVYLLSDVALENALTINKALTIEGNDHAVISGKSITTNADVTFKNLIYQNPTNSSNNASMFYGANGTKELVFEDCTFANPQWEVVQFTSKDQEKLIVKGCTFTAANVAGASTELYGNTANQAIRYLHIQPGTADNVTGMEIEITSNTFENCDKIKDSIFGFYYIEGTVKIGENTFADWAEGDVVEGKVAKLSIHWPENDSLKEVAKWTGEINTYTI